MNAAIQKRMLFQDCHRWLTELTNVGRKLKIPCAATLNESGIRQGKFADILIDAHYALEPRIAKDIGELAKSQNFRMYVILTYAEIPIADWKTGISYAFVDTVENDVGIQVPKPDALPHVERQVRLGSMCSFGHKQMGRLLHDATSLPVTITPRAARPI